MRSLHQHSKALSTLEGIGTLRVQQQKANQMQSASKTSIRIFSEGAKLRNTGDLLNLCEDLILSAT